MRRAVLSIVAAVLVSLANGITLRIAFVGDAYTYYNDLPHLVQKFLQTGLDGPIHLGACVRGGASLTTLWADGSNMHANLLAGKDLYPTVKDLMQSPQGWDVVILQDHSQGPARDDMREETALNLKTHYIPLLHEIEPHPLVILYETWGYIKPTKGSEEIGGYLQMSRRIVAGYSEYKELMEAGGLMVEVAGVGSAFKVVHDKAPDVWPRLYHHDHHHPTGLGTFLGAAHISAVIAKHKRFMASFPKGLKLPTEWPDKHPINKDLPPPIQRDISRMMSVAGPKIRWVEETKTTTPKYGVHVLENGSFPTHIHDPVLNETRPFDVNVDGYGWRAVVQRSLAHPGGCFGFFMLFAVAMIFLWMCLMWIKEEYIDVHDTLRKDVAHRMKLTKYE